MNRKFSFSTCVCEYDADEEKETSTVLEQIWTVISHFVQHNAAVLKKWPSCLVLLAQVFIQLHKKWK